MTAKHPSPKLVLGGTEVTRVGLGTNRLRRSSESVDFLREAIAAGVNVIDTAHTYTGGESEEAIGAALSPFPEDCIVATKGGYAPGHGRPGVLRTQIEESLRRLRTDSIGLYYLHRVDPETPLEESLGAIERYVEAGAIQNVGLSQVGIDEIERARRVVPIAAVQNHYNLEERAYEDVIDHCAAEDMVFLPYFPLHGIGARSLTDIARRRGVNPAQVAIAWLVRRSPTMLPIPGTLSLDHLRENLAALELELTDAEFQSLRQR